MTNPSISVIIPVYNNEKYVAEAIQSVLSQTFKPYEVIVINDGSTDRSADIAREFEPQIRFWHQSNIGISATRNKGIESASGDYLAFLDADDLWTPDKLKLQVEFLEKHPETEMILGTVKQFISPELNEEHHHKLRKELETMPGFVPGTLLIRKETFLRVGFFNEKLELGEFIDWFSRAKDMGIKYAVMDDIVLQRRIHTTNTGIIKKQHLKDYTTLLRAALERKRAQNQ